MKKSVLIIFAILLFACVKERRTEVVSSAGSGDMLVIASIGEPINLIPAISHDSASHEIAGLVYNGLVGTDKDLNLVGELAESWEVSPDNLSITFHLRKDVLWQDGVPFTSKDVLFTHRFITDNDTPTAYDKDFRMVSSISAADDYTVKVAYGEPYAPALISWGMWIMPAHLLDGVKATDSPLQRAPVGTGPFIFSDWKAGETLTLKANPAYFKGSPGIERIRYRFFQDQSTSFMELLSGNVDFSPLTPAQYAKQTDTERFKNQYNVYTYPTSGYSYIGYNLTRKPFDDKRVRQALSYATPKEQIIKTVLHGEARPALGPYKPGTVWYRDDLKIFGYAPDRAKALLAEAGFGKDSKGRLVRGGIPLKIELITNQNTTRQQIAEVVQAAWRELGIEVTIRVLEWGTFLSQHIDRRDFDATILAWNITLDPDQTEIWHSSNCKDSNPLNFICFKNGEADRLLEAGVRSFDTAVRKKSYDKLQEILAEEQPYTFLYYPNSLVAVSKRIKGITPAPAGINYNIEEWYVPKGERKY